MRHRSFFRSLHTDFLEPRLMLSAAPAHAQDNAEAAAARSATAQYHRVEEAIADGFVQVAVCADPDSGNPGTVGIVYLNPSRVDGVLNVDEPEALFYEEKPNGELRLVGVEYAVTQDGWHTIHGEEAPPPSMFGQEFHQNDNVGLYGIHLWWKHNPHGQFALEHPNLNC